MVLEIWSPKSRRLWQPVAPKRGWILSSLTKVSFPLLISSWYITLPAFTLSPFHILPSKTPNLGLETMEISYPIWYIVKHAIQSSSSCWHQDRKTAKSFNVEKPVLWWEKYSLKWNELSEVQNCFQNYHYSITLIRNKIFYLWRSLSKTTDHCFK